MKRTNQCSLLQSGTIQVSLHKKMICFCLKKHIRFVEIVSSQSHSHKIPPMNRFVQSECAKFNTNGIRAVISKFIKFLLNER